MFSLKGRAFWVDLGQGVLYCDLCALSSASDRNSGNDFGFIGLPKGCAIDYDAEEVDEEDASTVNWTMGRVGGSSICLSASAAPGPRATTRWSSFGRPMRSSYQMTMSRGQEKPR